ncbi:MAG: hypothetical protein AAF333_12510 [Planctomycetota bacterium]
MSQSAALLRLLEPTVRPVTAPGAAGKIGTADSNIGQAPFERQDFATLLASTQQDLNLAEASETAPESLHQAQPAGPLDLLADVGRIENPGLRELIARHADQPTAE